MNIDVTKLAAPIAFKTGDGNAIANLNGDRLVQNGTFSTKNIFRWMRLSSTRAANNQVRTEFLRSLGEAFGIEGATVGNDGKTRFSKEFMDRLEAIFGADFKRGDFGIKRTASSRLGSPSPSGASRRSSPAPSSSARRRSTSTPTGRRSARC